MSDIDSTIGSEAVDVSIYAVRKHNDSAFPEESWTISDSLGNSFFPDSDAAFDAAVEDAESDHKKYENYKDVPVLGVRLSELNDSGLKKEDRDVCWISVFYESEDSDPEKKIEIPVVYAILRLSGTLFVKVKHV